MLDLAVKNLAEQSEAGYEFELTWPPTGEKTGAFIKVRGAQSKVSRAFARKKYTEFRQKEQMAKRKGREDMAIETAITRIISWKGITDAGVEVPFNKENAERILREHSWIREAVVEESDQLLNFQ